MIARQVDQGIDVTGADLHRLHRIFRRRQDAQVGQHVQQAGGEERRIHAHDLARHLGQVGRRFVVGNEQRGIAKLQVDVDQDHVLAFL
ncbi:hypothetical protein D3C85_1500410 [compost metagenome]